VIEPWDEDDADEVRVAGRFKRLLDGFKKSLSNIRVFRIGDEDASFDAGSLLGGIHVYLVGEDSSGNLVALKTFSVET